jgi:hypothetical protein
VKPRADLVITIVHAPHVTPITAGRYHEKPRFGPNVTIIHAPHVTLIAARGYRQKTRLGSMMTIIHAPHVSPIMTRSSGFFFGPVIHAPHVKEIKVSRCAILAISRQAKLCALLTSVDEPAWSAWSRDVSSREDMVWDVAITRVDAPSWSVALSEFATNLPGANWREQVLRR